MALISYELTLETNKAYSLILLAVLRTQFTLLQEPIKGIKPRSQALNSQHHIGKTSILEVVAMVNIVKQDLR
jgi:hypothetical protein